MLDESDPFQLFVRLDPGLLSELNFNHVICTNYCGFNQIMITMHLARNENQPSHGLAVASFFGGRLNTFFVPPCTCIC